MKHIVLIALGLVIAGQVAKAQVNAGYVAAPMSSTSAIQQILAQHLLSAPGDLAEEPKLQAALTPNSGVKAEDLRACYPMQGIPGTMTCALIINGALFNILIENGAVTAADPIGPR